MDSYLSAIDKNNIEEKAMSTNEEKAMSTNEENSVAINTPAGTVSTKGILGVSAFFGALAYLGTLGVHCINKSKSTSVNFDYSFQGLSCRVNHSKGLSSFFKK